MLALPQYHTTHLRLTGDHAKQWEISRLGTEEEEQGLEAEIRQIEESLKDVNAWHEVSPLIGFSKKSGLADGPSFSFSAS
jgi:hypothetical protein